MIEAGEPIDAAYLKAGEWEVEIAGKSYPALVSLKPLYDPEMKKIKA
jgi:4-methylaminobutanoate oxidase (formaldehyde-forming)